MAHQRSLPNTAKPALALLRPTNRGTALFVAFRLLVALLGGRDLLLCAKHLFVAAMVAITDLFSPKILSRIWLQSGWRKRGLARADGACSGCAE